MAARVPKLTRCPACGSEAVKAVTGTWRGTYQGRAYSVPNLRYFECSGCGEKIYDPEAVRRIQDASPAFSRVSRNRRSA